MACATEYQNFLDKRVSFFCSLTNQVYTYTILQYAQWVSYQSAGDGITGHLPVSLIVTQWGIETDWGRSACFTDGFNLAGMLFTCDTNITRCGDCGRFAKFCNIRDSVRAYSQLIRIGYQHVGYAWLNGEGSNTGVKAASIALGQGYRTSWSYTTNYCLSNSQTVSSSNPRLWDQAGYNNGNGPGSSIYSRIAANTCLSNLNYVQPASPGLTCM